MLGPHLFTMCFSDCDIEVKCNISNIVAGTKLMVAWAVKEMQSSFKAYRWLKGMGEVMTWKINVINFGRTK